MDRDYAHLLSATLFQYSSANREPGTAEPHISRPINLHNFRGFLILMSDGLYEAYEAWTGRPHLVNEDIAHLVAEEMKKTSDLSTIAQNVVEKVKYLFRSTCRDGRRSGRLDDITLIVRNFGYPVPLPHTQSYPGDMANSTHSSVGGSGQPLFQESPRLQPSISYPSHMHGQPGPPAPYGSPLYRAAGIGPGAAYDMPTPPHHPNPHLGPDPRGYGLTHMSLSSGATAGMPPRVDRVLYSSPLGGGAGTPQNYSSLQTDPQSRHPQAGFDSTPPTNQGYNQGYYGGGRGGGYPSNYHQSLQQSPRTLASAGVGGSGAGLQQQQQAHRHLVHTSSEPDQHVLPHPASTKRLESSPYTPGSSPQTNVGQEPSGGQSGGRRGYENVPSRPLNTITEANDFQASSSPGKHLEGAMYENVVLRSTAQHNLRPGGDAGLTTNRYSDSCLTEKVHEVSLEKSKSGVNLGGGVPSVDIPARPHSAEPSRHATDDNLTSISALPGSQPPDFTPEDEDYLLYGWKKSTDDHSSMSTLKSNLSSSEMPSMPVSESASLSTMTGESESDAKTPIPTNGEARQLGSSTHQEEPASLPDDQPGEDEDDDEEGVLVMDMSDYSEASEAEDSEELDAESGEMHVRAYIKNWGAFPLDLSWEEV